MRGGTDWLGLFNVGRVGAEGITLLFGCSSGALEVGKAAKIIRASAVIPALNQAARRTIEPNSSQPAILATLEPIRLRL